MNPEKEDVHQVYIMYTGFAVEDTIYYDFEPVHLQTEILYGESYAILEEFNAWDLDSTFNYEVLFVTSDGEIILQKFYRNNLNNVTSIDSHLLFENSIWKIEETAYEYMNVEEIIRVVTNDIYSPTVSTNASDYRKLIKKSELFEQFFEDLYVEMDHYYRGNKRDSDLKWAFAFYLQNDYGVQFEQSEGTDIILSNCAALMQKLKLSQFEMAEYFMKYYYMKIE